MTNLLPYSTIQNTAGDGAGAPGAAPLGPQMQGNPQSSQFTPNGNYLPGNQNAPQQLAATQISAGNIILSSVPINVLTSPGTDSLLAQMSRGQVILKDSTYGLSQTVPANGGAANSVVPALATVATGPANGLTYPAPGAQNYTGN
jgi:hypothetical protein